MRITKAFFLIALCVLAGAFAQVIWTETSYSDFADGSWDTDLFVSQRANFESTGGAIEWLGRFDLDNNGYCDFAGIEEYVITLFNNQMRVWFLTSSGYEQGAYSLGSRYTSIGGDILFADLNTDGWPEIIFSGEDLPARIYWNNPTGSYGSHFSESDYTALTYNRAEAVVVADFDRDGYLDIVTPGVNSPMYLYWGGPGGTKGWQVAATTTIAEGSFTHNCDIVDMNNDGLVDILLHKAWSTPHLRLLTNTGSRTFTATNITTNAPDSWKGLSIADLDKDGDIDIVGTTYLNSGTGSGQMEIRWNNGSASFPTYSTLTPGECYAGSAIEDLDLDGDLDIVVARGDGDGIYTGEPIKIYWNSGSSPYFTEANSWSSSSGRNASAIVTTDANSDGYPDVFIAGNQDDYSMIFWGPSFTSTSTYAHRFAIANGILHGMFREPGRILDRAKSASYTSSIFDAGAAPPISGNVQWVAYDDRDWSSGSMPDPIGTAVRIYLRVGRNATVDTSWTTWTELSDGGAIPATHLGRRYLQYRADLNYTHPARLPWLERIQFSFTPCTPAVFNVDTVWFSQETNCDSRADITVNYILTCTYTDSLTQTSARASSDGGVSWGITMTDLADIAGDLGNNILPGTHSFRWNAATDLPNFESHNLAIQVGIGATFSSPDTGIGDADTHKPTVNIESPTGVFHGIAHIFRWGITDLFRSAAACSVTFSCCGARTNFTTIDTFISWTPPAVCAACTVFVRARDVYCNWGYDTATFASAAACSGWISNAAMSQEITCDGQDIVNICYTMNTNCVGEVYEVTGRASSNGGATWTVPFSTVVAAAGDFGANVGAGSHCFQWNMGADAPGVERRNLAVEISIGATHIKPDTAFAPCDAKPPVINITCDTLIPTGINHVFHWSAADSFLRAGACSVMVSVCGARTFLTPTDTLVNYTPATECAACTVIVARSDSFCNWGKDTCIFRTQCVAQIESVWANQENSCDGRNIVSICYDLTVSCPARTVYIDVTASTDGGTTWAVEMDSIFNATGDLRDGVTDGIHCFDWEMGVDLPDFEADDVLFRIKGWKTIQDTLARVAAYRLRSNAEGISIRGLGFDGTNIWLMSSIVTTGFVDKVYKLSNTGGIIDSVILSIPDSIYFDGIDFIGTELYATEARTRSLYHIDLTTGACNELIHSYMAFSAQGLAYDGSFVWTTDGRSPTYYFYKIDPATWTHLGTATLAAPVTSGTDDMTYAFGRLWVVNNLAHLYRLNETATAIERTFYMPNPVGDYGPEGLAFDGTNIWYADNDRDSIYVFTYRGDTIQSISRGTICDSKTPIVEITCPSTMVPMGTAHTFNWNITDAHELSTPACSLHFWGCGIDQRFVSVGTSYSWNPTALCVNCTLFVKSPDSLCNWGIDTCVFTIGAPAIAFSINNATADTLEFEATEFGQYVRQTGTDTLRVRNESSVGIQLGLRLAWYDSLHYRYIARADTCYSCFWIWARFSATAAAPESSAYITGGHQNSVWGDSLVWATSVRFGDAGTSIAPTDRSYLWFLVHTPYDYFYRRLACRVSVKGRVEMF